MQCQVGCTAARYGCRDRTDVTRWVFSYERGHSMKHHVHGLSQRLLRLVSSLGVSGVADVRKASCVAFRGTCANRGVHIFCSINSFSERQKLGLPRRHVSRKLNYTEYCCGMKHYVIGKVTKVSLLPITAAGAAVFSLI